MIDHGKQNVLGILVDALDYDAAVARITAAAHEGRGYAVTALAVHGVMTGVGDDQHRYRLNTFDLVTPDGQPVRWAMNVMYGTKLPDRVYGPRMTVKVCEAAAREGLPLYLYGSKQSVVETMAKKLEERFPGIKVAGFEPSKFRPLKPDEKRELVERVRNSGAKIMLVGLGCPRQEVFAYEYRDEVQMPVMAVGAAFDYISGNTAEPPMWIQNLGLQWAYRWAQEPKRLFKRYAFLNPAFIACLVGQKLRLWNPDPTRAQPPKLELSYG